MGRLTQRRQAVLAWQFQILLLPVAETRILTPMIDSAFRQLVERQLFSQPIPSLVEALSYDGRMERLWKFVEENYHEPKLTLEQAAKQCGVAKNHMNELLFRAARFTFHQLLIRYRLFKGVELMCQKHLTVLEVALASGFGDESSFRRNFKKLLGSAPKTFQKKLRQQGWVPKNWPS